MEIEVILYSKYNIDTLELSYQIFDLNNSPKVYNFFSTSSKLKNLIGKSGEIKFNIVIENLRLYKGEYYFRFNLSDPRGQVIYDFYENILSFSVDMGKCQNEWGWATNACVYIENAKINF